MVEDKLKVPQVTPHMYRSVSNYRRDQLEGEVQRGFFREGSGKLNAQSALSPASYASTGVSKYAQSAEFGAAGGGGFRGSSGNTNYQIPETYSPLWLTSNMNMPRDRATMNAWCRSFYALNPIVQNAIDLHSTYPISKLNIKCPNKKVEKFFGDMIDELDLVNVCCEIAQEYWLLGESFVYADLDESLGKWTRLRIQNPDFIAIKSSVMADEPLITLKPDENLKRICTSNLPGDMAERRKLDETIINYVRKGQNIPFDNMNISHLARRISPYDPRGTGLPVSIFRSLMLFDQLKECKYVQSSDLINPMRIVKIGGGAADYRPTPVDLDAWREVWEAANANKNFKIFTHDAVAIETVGAGSGIYDTTGDFAQLMKEMYAGLMIPQIVIEGGGDITYANGGVSLEVLRERYMRFRNIISSWLRRKIFHPISKINEFYDYVDGVKTLTIPEIDWNHMNLFDMEFNVNTLKELTTSDDKGNKRASLHSLYRAIGLDWDEERRKIRKEDIDQAIRKKEQETLDKMNLNELRSLNEDDEIPELLEAPLPGSSPYDGEPGAGGAPSSGDGSLPGMSPPPEIAGGPGGSAPAP